jgi:hypothetical protein
MKPLSFIVALLLLAVAARAEKLSIGRFEVSWEDGWSLVSKADPIRYAGPGPTGVTIDLLDHDEMSATQKKAEKEKWFRYAKEELPKLALRHGEIVVPFKEEKLDSGYTLFSLATAKKQGGTDYFGLVFVSVSPEGRFAQFAVEGFGDANTKFPIFHNFMVSGKWKTEPNQLLQTMTMTVPVAAKPLCGPAIAMSDR